MARERMVTRTVNEAIVDVLCVDVLTHQVETRSFKISAFVEKELVCKHLTKIYKGVDVFSTLRFVECVSYVETETLYGMSEDMFIRLAEVLPPRGTTATAE